MKLKEILPETHVDFWEERANKVLSHFDYQEPDEIDMYEICWYFGIKVKRLDPYFHGDYTDDDTKAFSLPKEIGRRGIIYLRPGLGAIETKLILAEEFCHIYAHHINQFDVDVEVLNRTEKQAKRMAAYLLMPQKFLDRVFVTLDNEAVLILDLADYFLVTEEFAQYRLELIFNRKVDAVGKMDGKLGSIQFK
ncbi:MAG: ImmA/IrrE family metallo-endopeptidase [Bacillaceae bacterium]|nr:ImmA/IrrE family metallo-endopeptidase [Bacillaceae bacterium]